MTSQIGQDVSMDFSQQNTSKIGGPAPAGPGDTSLMKSSTMKGRMPAEMQERERKIDNSQFEPLSHKKTLTLINYFILNTSQFLNSFSNVADTKIHDIDEKLDELETVISIFEQKLDSLPEEAFLWEPEENEDEEGIEGLAQNPAAALAATETMQQPQYLAPTENALIAAGSNPKAPPPVAIKPAPGASNSDYNKNALIMGPPPNTPPVKAPGPPPPLPSSYGKPPPSMPTAAPVAAPGGGGGGDVAQDQQAPMAGGAADPDDARKDELEDDPVFKKYLTALKMRIPPAQLVQQITAQGIYSVEDLLLFCNSE